MTEVALERKTEIKSIVCEIMELDPDDVTDTSLFKEDHGADSLLVIEVVAELEKRYGIVIEQSDMSAMVNVDGVCTTVAHGAGW